jgi:hypothetical protein
MDRLCEPDSKQMKDVIVVSAQADLPGSDRAGTTKTQLTSNVVQRPSLFLMELGPGGPSGAWELPELQQAPGLGILFPL